MLSAPELELLYLLDAGAFLGGSTLALACGLRDNLAVTRKAGRVHSYDLFVANRFTTRRLRDLREGASTRACYDGVIADVAAHVTVDEGDITTFPWPSDRPIEILFIDVATSWEVNDFLLQSFFPSLIPGVSSLIQQDYHWPHTPWLSITMEVLADHVTYLGSLRVATAHYRWERALEPGEIPARLQDLGADRLRALAARAQRFTRRSREWTAQQCNLVALCLAFGRVDDAAEIFDDTVAAAPVWLDYFEYAPALPAGA